MELTYCCLKGWALLLGFFFILVKSVGISYSSYVNRVNNKQHQSPAVGCLFPAMTLHFGSFLWLILLKGWWLDSNFSQFTQPLRWRNQTRLHSLKWNLHGDVSVVIYCGRNNKPQKQSEVVLWEVSYQHSTCKILMQVIHSQSQSSVWSTLEEDKTIGTDNPQANSVQFCYSQDSSGWTAAWHGLLSIYSIQLLE